MWSDQVKFSLIITPRKLVENTCSISLLFIFMLILVLINYTPITVLALLPPTYRRYQFTDT